MNEFGVYHTEEKNQIKSLQAATGRDVATAASRRPARPRRKPPWDAILYCPSRYHAARKPCIANGSQKKSKL